MPDTEILVSIDDTERLRIQGAADDATAIASELRNLVSWRQFTETDIEQKRIVIERSLARIDDFMWEVLGSDIAPRPVPPLSLAVVVTHVVAVLLGALIGVMLAALARGPA